MLLTLCCSKLQAQTKVFVINAYYNTSIPNVQLIYSNNVKIMKDSQKYFLIKDTLPLTIICKSQGFNDQIFHLNKGDKIKTIYLEPISSKFDTIRILANSIGRPGTLGVSASAASAFPAIGGETDIIKAIQMFAPVTAVQENNTSPIVRGANVDAVSTEIDNQQIFIQPHFFGLVSAFNPYLVEGAKIETENIRADNNYGHAKINLESTESHLFKSKVMIDANLVSVKGAVSIPIVKGKTGVTLGYRNASSGFLSKITDDNYNFRDFGGKLNHQWGKTKISAFYNHSFDHYNFGFSIPIPDLGSNTKWRSNALLLNSSTALSKNNNLNFSCGYSNFNNSNTFAIAELTRANRLSTIRFKSEYTAKKFDVGMAFNSYTTENTNSKLFFGTLDSTHLQSNSILVYTNYKLTYKNFILFSGIRASYFTDKNIAIEPRLSLYNKRSYGTFGISYDRTATPLYILSNNSFLFPNDYWYTFKPQISNQFVVSFQYPANKYFKLTAKAYYRMLPNLRDYKITATNASFDTSEITTLQGTNYGIEVSTEYRIKRFLLNFNYTYSKCYTQGIDLYNNRKINANWDRPHNIKFFGIYYYRRITLSFDFLLQNGRPVTLPISTSPIVIYSQKNQYRLPLYHRADLQLSWIGKNKLYDWRMYLSIYNAYNHLNIYDIVPKGITNSTSEYASITLFPIIPLIGCEFKF